MKDYLDRMKMEWSEMNLSYSTVLYCLNKTMNCVLIKGTITIVKKVIALNSMVS